MHRMIEQRLRSTPPASAVVAGSTPVPSFGDAGAAHVVTIGINPSRVEFLDRSGRLMQDGAARFVSLPAPQRYDLVDAPDADIARVYDSCCRYFARNPYRRWFDLLEEQLNRVGASYYDGSAAHIDLAQWATDPTWGRLSSKDKQLLLNDGREFLNWQLRQPTLRLALVNGRAVLRAFEECVAVHWDPIGTFSGLAGQRATLFGCHLLSGVRVIAWSTNLQSSFGVTRQFRHDLGVALERAARSL